MRKRMFGGLCPFLGYGAVCGRIGCRGELPTTGKNNKRKERKDEKKKKFPSQHTQHATKKYPILPLRSSLSLILSIVSSFQLRVFRLRSPWVIVLILGRRSDRERSISGSCFFI
ncbi:uncharacterized protein K452DRAFT_244373 [Aplosporella prunicola CBS 121167]|uniref:Uncharacterized protein n=1 Tax=Aplosporella prunicola CBS 121167 TaxID=1176127 RepID=A0A6A6BLC8_9PEZI|nr:uncharacterized protein K452DRAFT_244373 [Aplosporella prunicola CBS 121167]KAF2144910.1 hypothetical protein K452DRAFT_244373 [Aplosporella prunicola CBS 121167]